MDANLLHISYESGILENPSTEPPKDLFLMTTDPTQAEDKPYRMEIGFKQGLPAWVKSPDGVICKDPLDIFVLLNKLGGEHGIGRIDIVENRFIGLKVRMKSANVTHRFHALGFCFDFWLIC